MKLYKKNCGFTLIEIVIAVAIFAVIISIVFPALLQFLQMRERVVEKNEEIINLQKTFLFLANDLRYAANRLDKDEFGDLRKTTISIGDDSVLDFTALYPDLAVDGLNVPRRVRWILEDDVLTREQFPVMDPENDTRKLIQSLMTDIDDINIQVHEIQEGRDRVESAWEEQQKLPDLIDIEITMINGVEYRRLFTMFGGDASQLEGQLNASLDQTTSEENIPDAEDELVPDTDDETAPDTDGESSPDTDGEPAPDTDDDS